MRRLALLLAALPLLGALPLDADPPKKPGAGKPPPEPQFGVPDAALQTAINAAIDKGVAWLKAQQKPNGSFAGLSKGTETRHEVGTPALCGLAMLASGEVPHWRKGKKENPGPVDGVMAFCKAKDAEFAGAGRHTYDVGALIMFVTEYYRDPPVEAKPGGHTQQGKGGKNPCNLPPEALAWIQDMATWLCGVQKDSGGWGYPAHREDASNIQYALLGLRAARDCGAIVPVTTFEKALRFMLDWQEQDGPKVKRIVPSGDPDRPYAFEAGDRARGFVYLKLPNVGPTGSMTTSGIAVLAICHDALLRPKRLERYDAALEAKTTRGIQDAFTWLEKHWDVTKNPGPGAPNWHHYYLYGLERAGALAGRAAVGTHDWYLEGARLLVAKQQADGRWHTGALGGADGYEASDVLDTAWALLFLRRATRPAQPVPPPQVTESD